MEDVEKLHGYFQQRGIELFFAPLPNCFSGALRYRKDLRRWFCIINDRPALTRQRFTAAHELFHYDHHRHLVSLFDDYSVIGSRLEREANRGAANMLMPENRIRAHIETLRAVPYDLIGHMARVFKVSWKEMWIRLKELGITLDNGYVKKEYQEE